MIFNLTLSGYCLITSPTLGDLKNLKFLKWSFDGIKTLLITYGHYSI